MYAQNKELVTACLDMLRDLDSFDGPEKYVEGEYAYYNPAGKMLDMKHAARIRKALVLMGEYK